MPMAQLQNGVSLYYEETGQGFPLIFAHELAGSYESWRAQVSYFSRRYRVITYNARGYPPSDVPPNVDDYSQEQVVEDLYQLLQHLGIEKAHVAGLSMGGNMALWFGLTHPEVAKSIIVAGRRHRQHRPRYVQQAVNRLRGNAGIGRHGGHGRLPARPHAHPLPPEGPPRLAGVRGPLCRPLGAGEGAHPARLPGAKALHHDARRGAAGDAGAHAHHPRRRGRPVLGARHLHEAPHPSQRHHGAAADGPCLQHRGARRCSTAPSPIS